MKKRYLVGLACGVIMLGMTGMATAVPVQWAIADGGNDHWYEVVDAGTNNSWETAENNAQQRGGHLVTVNSAQEQEWLGRFYTDGIDRFYNGYSDAVQEGNWVWSSGEQTTYTNWAPGEPNNSLPPFSGEDYTEMIQNPSFSTGFYWNDMDPSRYGADYHIDGIAEYTTFPVSENCSQEELDQAYDHGRNSCVDDPASCYLYSQADITNAIQTGYNQCSAVKDPIIANLNAVIDEKNAKIAEQSELIKSMYTVEALNKAKEESFNAGFSEGLLVKEVTICHNGKETKTISSSAWPAHKSHGDMLGKCK